MKLATYFETMLSSRLGSGAKHSSSMSGQEFAFIEKVSEAGFEKVSSLGWLGED